MFKLSRDLELISARPMCWSTPRDRHRSAGASVVAIDKVSGRVLQVGRRPGICWAGPPGNVVAVRPLRQGVISDYEMTEKMLSQFLKKIIRYSLIKPRVVVCVPSGITEVEERAVIQAAMEAGARRVYLIEEPFAAALGAGLDLSGPNGHMVVDIGGGTTDIAVLSLNDIAVSSSMKIAGDTFDEAIVTYIRRRHGLAIGLTTAEEIKITVGCVTARPEEVSMTVKGRDVKTGLPRDVLITSSEMLELLSRPARLIVDEILNVLELSSPELVADVSKNGIVLTGGGSLIWGMDRIIHERTEIPCMVADNAESCVALGCGKSLNWINSMQEGTINIARRKLMKEQ